MLIHLHVSNLALIEETEVDFKEGLNILTGETGAGKSILIGSINLALGQRVVREMIRDESKPALVELVFEVSEECSKRLEEMDIPMEDRQVIISRRITDKRSISKINGETVTAAVLKQAAELLIDIHGQHEHQSLLKKENHLKILDAFAGKELEKPLAKAAASYRSYQTLQKRLEEFTVNDAQREREISFLQYEIQEIEEADLQAGEDEQLEKDYRKMLNGQKLIQGLNEVYQLTGGDDAASGAEYISAAARKLSALTAIDDAVDELFGQIQDIESLLEDFNRDVQNQMEECEFSEEEFHFTEERLNLLNHLKSKYGNTVEEVLGYMERQQKRLKELQDYENSLAALQKERQQAEEQLEQACVKVSSIRSKYAKKLAQKVKEGLVDLNFLDVQFELSLKKTAQCHANGWDEAEFLISTNPGEPLRPLGKVASGGELSRIMLAIKTVLADKDEIDTLIFDEIDVGISGRTAQRVSEKMAVIAKSRQVICITHLAQIAAMADCHFAIEKTSRGKETVTDIRSLSRDEMVEELARILGGAEITRTVLENAREMKELAEQSK